MKLDLHIHTKYSGDSWCCPCKAVKTARDRGLDGLAITDHNSTRGWEAALEAGKRLGVPVVLGEEVVVKTGDQTVGEILGLFLTEPIRSRDPFEIIDLIKAQGGVAIIPHPFDGFRGFNNLKHVLDRVDGLEVLNARAMSDQANKKARELAVHHKLAQIGGSDAHSLMEIGRAWTEAKATDLEGFRKALLARQTRVFGRRSNVLVHALSTLARVQRVKH